MTDAPSPNDQSSKAAAVGGGNQLNPTNSQIGNAAQIIGSPGAVVNQLLTESSPSVAGVLAGIFGVLLLLLVATLPLVGRAVPDGLVVLLVGASSMMIVGGFFSWVESLLKYETRHEIAVRLFGAAGRDRDLFRNWLEPWPSTFRSAFHRVFGVDHYSFRCLVASCLLSTGSVALTFAVWASLHPVQFTSYTSASTKPL